MSGNSKPLSWDELTEVLGKGDGGANLRSAETEKKYAEYKNWLKSRGMTVEEHILARLRATTDFPTKKYAILRNDFPYNISPEISHFIIWLSEELGKSAENRAADFIPAEYLADGANWAIHVNSAKNKSVGLPHAHLFIHKASNPSKKLNPATFHEYHNGAS